MKTIYKYNELSVLHRLSTERVNWRSEGEGSIKDSFFSGSQYGTIDGQSSLIGRKRIEKLVCPVPGKLVERSKTRIPGITAL